MSGPVTGPARRPAPGFRPPQAVEVETSRPCDDFAPTGDRMPRGAGAGTRVAAGRAGGADRVGAPHHGADQAQSLPAPQRLMEWPLFDRIARELGELGYAGWLAFHHCREPLLNPRLVREVEHVRALVPGARPAIETDGDLLTPPLLVDLLRLGSGHVRVTRWPGEGEGEAGPADQSLRRWLLSGGLLDALPWRFREERHGWVAVYERDDLRIDVVRPRTGVDRRRWSPPRGATCAARRSPEPCRPEAGVASIDCTGRLATCRGIFGDGARCGRHTIGDLREQAFADLWSSPTLVVRH